MVCKECYFNYCCYAMSPLRKKCDPFAKDHKEEYFYYRSELERLHEAKKNSIGIRLERIQNEIDQLEEFCEWVCTDISLGEQDENNLPF